MTSKDSNTQNKKIPGFRYSTIRWTWAGFRWHQYELEACTEQHIIRINNNSYGIILIPGLGQLGIIFRNIPLFCTLHNMVCAANQQKNKKIVWTPQAEGDFSDLKSFVNQCPKLYFINHHHHLVHWCIRLCPWCIPLPGANTTRWFPRRTTNTIIYNGTYYGNRSNMVVTMVTNRPWRHTGTCPIVCTEDLRWRPCSMIVYVCVYMWPCFMIYYNI